MILPLLLTLADEVCVRRLWNGIRVGVIKLPKVRERWYSITLAVVLRSREHAAD